MVSGYFLKFSNEMSCLDSPSLITVSFFTNSQNTAAFNHSRINLRKCYGCLLVNTDYFSFSYPCVGLNKFRWWSKLHLSSLNLHKAEYIYINQKIHTLCIFAKSLQNLQFLFNQLSFCFRGMFPRCPTSAPTSSAAVSRSTTSSPLSINESKCRCCWKSSGECY